VKPAADRFELALHVLGRIASFFVGTIEETQLWLRFPDKRALGVPPPAHF
jgi:hypothetical protein